MIVNYHIYPTTMTNESRMMKETTSIVRLGLAHRVFMEFCKRGLLTMAYDPKFRIQPAMNIDAATIDESVEIMQEVFDDMKTSWRWSE